MLVSAIGKFDAVKIINNSINNGKNTFNGDKNAVESCTPHYDINTIAKRTENNTSQPKTLNVVV